MVTENCSGPPAVLGPAGGRGGAPGPPLPRPVLPRERYFDFFGKAEEIKFV